VHQGPGDRPSVSRGRRASARIHGGPGGHPQSRDLSVALSWH
jgi:hypothetical protein